MKKILFLSIFFFLFSIDTRAVEVVAVTVYNIKPYKNALAGFREGCNCSVKEMVFPKGTEPSHVEKQIRLEDPSLLYAIGEKGLKFIRHIKDLPIVYSSVPIPRSVIPKGSTNIAGVDMMVPPEVKVAKLLKTLPRVRKVGMVYDPKKSAWLIKDLHAALKKAGLEIVARTTENPRKVPELIHSLAGHVDAYWMVPDLTALYPVSVDELMKFSRENMVPVYTFSDHFVEEGALMGINMSDAELGLQAGKMASQILSGIEMRKLPKFLCKKVVFYFNEMLAKAMGITPLEALIVKAGDNITYKIEDF